MEAGCFPSSGQATPNLMDPLDRAILSQWAPQNSKIVKMCTWEHPALG